MLKVLDSAVPVACWSCSVAHNESTLFCPDCSKIQPPSTGDFFSVFGIERRLNLDLAALERAFHRLSRQLHPDRFVRASASEKQWSLADTALVNDAYRTLKDPLRRTEYLLNLEGVEMGAPADASRALDQKTNLLEEVFELNMQLDEMRAAKKAGQRNAELEETLRQARKWNAGRVEAVDCQMREQWTRWDAGDAAARTAAQRELVALLDRRRFLSNLLRDVNEILKD